jgi:cytochrome c oxidase subunit 2
MKRFLPLFLLILSACNGDIGHGTGSTIDGPTEFISNGERIYFTGSSGSGSSITVAREDGFGMEGMHRRMHGGGCASCHGVERGGQRMMPRFWIKAPALTPEALFGDNDHGRDSDDHGDHENYDVKTLRLAITSGVDPSGEALNTIMPRWSMSEVDLTDLIEYLQQSHEHN